MADAQVKNVVTTTARVVRRFAGGAQLTRTVELPMAPTPGLFITLPTIDGSREVLIERVVLDPVTWGPGVRAVSVRVELAVEADVDEAAARSAGWKPLGAVTRLLAVDSTP